MNYNVSLSYGKSCLILSNSGNGGNSLFQEWDISQISLMIKHLDLQTDLNLSVVLLSSDLPLVSPSEERPLASPCEERPLASPCEERPLASPCGAKPPPAAAAACQSIIVIFGENKQKQSADKRKITHCFILIKISTMQDGLEILFLCELRFLVQQNTALFSTFLLRSPVRLSQAWHINFSRYFDGLYHENHIFSECISTRLTTWTTWNTWTTWTTWITWIAWII